jgi:hypothetical protein
MQLPLQSQGKSHLPMPSKPELVVRHGAERIIDAVNAGAGHDTQHWQAAACCQLRQVSQQSHDQTLRPGRTVKKSEACIPVYYGLLCPPKPRFLPTWIAEFQWQAKLTGSRRRKPAD